jgi:hypothetical protein
MQRPRRSPDPRLRDVVVLAVGVAGLALCLTLIYLGMRAVMDIGGTCADGGPYVSANPCPDGVPATMVLAIFGLFLFGGLALWGGSGTGGYGWILLAAWTGLFALLGWNFLDYGLVNPPEGQGVEWGWVIPGVLFQVMAWAPVAIAIWGMREARGSGPATVTLPGPGQPASDGTPGEHRPPPVPGAYRTEVAGSGRQAELQGIDDAMGALVAGAAPAPGGSAAAVDRLERLGEMRSQGLLTADEYETAKEAVMRELEAGA